MIGSTRTPTAAGRPSLLVIGLGPTGIEVALALAESNRCCVSLGDDALASESWIQSASCLLNGVVASAANAGVGKTMKRSQFLSAMLTSVGAQSVRALSPVGDASTVERFDVVVMTDPTLPHAIAFNEHARAVGCGFILAEARGAVGRLFRDLGGSGDSGYSSRSLRGCLLDPWFVPYNPNTYSDQNGGVEAASRTLTPPMLLNVRRESESTSPLRLQRTSVNGRESASAGLLASSEYVRQQAKGEGQEAAAVPTAGRRAQFHVCFQALHMFWQEHGHLPVILDRDQADEVVRIADEAVETGRNVPKGFSSQPETVDITLCRRVATISRVPVPAVSFQLGGLVAAVVFNYVQYHRFVNLTARDCTLNTGRECRGKGGAEQQWLFVDELDAGLRQSDSGRTGAWKDERCDEHVAAVDPSPLEAWLGVDLLDSVAGARVAVIGCGRLGRDFVRCLLLTGACTGPRGRMVFIDHGDAAPGYSSPTPKSQRCQADGSVIRGRAAVLRDAVSRHTRPGGSRVSAFDGAVQDTDAEMDLWQGVDAVVMCVGREAGGVDAKRAGGVARGGCEALVRFVSHKCVLHGKPLVWGWAGGAGEGGAGVEVMVPGRTSCLVCSSHGGMKEIIERRNVIRTETATPPDDRAPSPRPRQAPFSTPERGHRHCPVDAAWDPNGHCFGVTRSAAAGVMAAELVKALNPRCHRQDFRNWRLKVNRDSGRRSSKDGSTRGRGGGYTDGQGERHSSLQLQDTTLSERPSHVDEQQTYMGSGVTVLPVVTTPDPPSMVLSTSFDPFTGGSLRAIPAGFTEWGVEEIRPSLLEPRDSPRRGKIDTENPFSLRVLVRTVFTRFGVDVKAIAAAAPGSECRVGAGGIVHEQGGGCGRKILWAQWEKSDPTNRGKDGQSLVSKMDQTVFSLWQQVVSPIYRGEEGKRASFLFLDVRGVMGEENAVLPVLKYWVR